MSCSDHLLVQSLHCGDVILMFDNSKQDSFEYTQSKDQRPNQYPAGSRLATKIGLVVVLSTSSSRAGLASSTS